MKKKLVILHPAHWKQLMGGAELQIKYLTEYILKEGYEVHYIFEENGNKIDECGGIILYPLKSKIIRGLGETFILNSIKIFNLLRKIEPDVIYTRMYSSWTGVASIYARKFGKKHIWAIASNTDVERKMVLKLIVKPLNFLTYQLIKYSFKNVNQIISQNDYQQTQIKTRYKRDSVKITQLGKAVKESKINKNNSTIKILWIANFKPLKQPELFKELAKKINSITNYQMIMVGNIPSTFSLGDWNDPQIKLTCIGKKNNEEINDLLIKSHILINTSKHEGFSNTFVQAWMRKVPVISMNSNPDDILTKENIGFVCPTIDELVEKTELLITNHQLRKEMGERAYKYATENHSLEKNMPVILELFK